MAVVPLGYQPILDGTVEVFHNYRAAGIYHHNTGKSEAGAFEATLHATGRYPHWWKGRRFDGPTEGWAAGSTLETMRDIVQAKLLGPVDRMGTGMIPYDDIVEVRNRPNSNGAVDYVIVRNQHGAATSKIGFKSYDQGRRNFEGTAKAWCWLDEEPPSPVYTECLTRTATTRGLIWCTFTPLNGATEVVREFMAKAALRV